ncbi:MAG: Crp/Fnr family transcriptional regulator [Ignavibacteria bacterium]|nr:Crp/Fnr family transcriptional regulator [Ignavibacteria bacterium]
MDSSILRNVNLFSELDDEDLDKIYSRAGIRKFSKGEMVFFDTEPYLGFYIVAEGSVKVFKILKDGREHILYFIKPFNTFAEVPLFEQYEKVRNDEFTYPANAMAIEDDTVLILIRSSEIYNLIEKNSRLCMKIISGLAKKLRHMNKHIESISLDVPKRLAKFILEESKSETAKNELHVELQISKHDLSSYLGTIDETLSRTFKKFQDEGILEVSGRNIYIKNKEALKKISKD